MPEKAAPARDPVGDPEQGSLSRQELRQEGGEEVVDRETTSFVNAQNMIEEAEERRREKEES